MKELVVVSGKGGVGKTTFTASLALLLWRAGINLVAADTDVDAPNLALLLTGKEVKQEPVSVSEKAFIDYEKCNGCGKCIPACKFDAIHRENGKVVIERLLCEGCGVCALLCPETAIEIKEVESGQVATTETEYGFPLITGRLNIGESGSGKIVAFVKAEAKIVAKNVKAELILVDGPPGVGCPVISAMSGAHQVIAITEPTPVALHDLDRVLSVAKHFNLASSIVLNKANLHEETRKAIIRYAEERGIEILGEIPLDDAVPRAIAESMPVVEYAPGSPASRAIAAIADRVLASLR
ncbi:MAG TPA: (4Fe-4S)-binding protein [Candidatus Bathyarchaeota archaeon]|nr:(4Fe-4S)-binding protein [Candidatus Bathyarchaeota archaeon]